MLKVLIVDDESIIRDRLINCFNWESIGFAVCGEAENAEDALEIIKKTKPHVVLLDINMPGENGLWFAGALNELYSDIHIIFLTGYAKFEYARAAIRVNAYDYLLKPINKDELLSTLLCLKSQILNISSVEDNLVTLSDLEKLKKQLVENINNINMFTREKQLTSAIVEQAVRYIDNHFADRDISLNAIAERVFSNPAYLSSLFSKEMGCTINSYITEKRMLKAANLLIIDGMSVVEAAYATGYKDPYYFSRRFKKYFDIEPSNYIKQKK